MKRCFLLAMAFVFAVSFAAAQAVERLPAGRYQTKLKSTGVPWSHGDLLLQQDGHYRLSASSEGGEFKFSVAAQRVFFTSGPLKGLLATTLVQRQQPVIVLHPTQGAGLPIDAEVWAYYSQ